MSNQPIHFLPVESIFNESPCGANRPMQAVTPDRSKVTCEACLRALKDTP